MYIYINIYIYYIYHNQQQQQQQTTIEYVLAQNENTVIILYSTNRLTSYSIIIIIINVPIHYCRFIVRFAVPYQTPIIYNNQQHQKGEKERGNMYVPLLSLDHTVYN